MTLQTVELNFRKYVLVFIPTSRVCQCLLHTTASTSHQKEQHFANLIDRLIPHFLIALL